MSSATVEQLKNTLIIKHWNMDSATHSEAKGVPTILRGSAFPLKRCIKLDLLLKELVGL